MGNLCPICSSKLLKVNEFDTLGYGGVSCKIGHYENMGNAEHMWVKVGSIVVDDLYSGTEEDCIAQNSYIDKLIELYKKNPYLI